MENGFSTKQQRLVDSYDGSIKLAAEQAGLIYGACQLLTKPNILAAIRNRQDTEIRPKEIADRQERQRFWTRTTDYSARQLVEFHTYLRLILANLLLLAQSPPGFITFYHGEHEDARSFNMN